MLRIKLDMLEELVLVIKLEMLEELLLNFILVNLIVHNCFGLIFHLIYY